MKIQIFKANGHTFNTMYEVRRYAEKNGFRITDTSKYVSTKTNIVTLVELQSIN